MTDHILIVDDEQQTLDLLRIMLRPLNRPIESVMNGHDTLISVEYNPPRVILLDFMLPDMTGLEVCTRLKADASAAHIPVIFYTASHDKIIETQAQDAGADYFLRKPATRAMLCETIETALRKTLPSDA
ncbi:MAG TPA: response regulator [Aggregatilineales bacterium]|nr:response regulator [Anaerolineales bacterium]HRE49322.1 response regulator [Aggregatilineales bacterium]